MTGSWERISFIPRGDDNGQLVAIQGDIEVPFQIRRIYYMRNIHPSVVRGRHAHKQLDQVLIAVSGRCRVRVENGSDREEFDLQSPNEGLRITNLVWREMWGFSADCVLLVLASDVYKVEDYIRDYDEFKTLALKGLS